jgi:predicted GIY-YIG superfamily endonuclease
MTNKKKAGIWMDHSSAEFIGYPVNKSNEDLVELNFTHEDMQEALNRSENLMHNKRQQKQAAFYKEIGDIILKYDEVLLFGPTDAKVELVNFLEEDHHFDAIHIEVKEAEKMTKNQLHSFVNDHFND